MKKFNKVCIIGVGLIGGSLGLALKKKKLAKKVVGLCRRKVSLKAAARKKACDTVTEDYEKALKNADMVIISVPVSKIVHIAKKINKYIERDIILTDVGSTKQYVVSQIENAVPKNIKFVGSHPMAGSEKTGVKSARPGLFEGAKCIITRTKRTDSGALKTVKGFWEKLGSECTVMTPEKHDYYVSLISHLPHLVSSALTLSCDPKSLRFASTGFKDTTRISVSDSLLWRDIFFTNRKAVLNALRVYKKTICRIESAIKHNDSKAITKLLKRSKRIREETY